MTRQLSALAWFGALSHLDLQLFGAIEVLAGNSESAAGDLLNGAGSQIAVRIGRVAGRILASFPGVALAADSVHGNGERFVSLLGNRAERHRPGRKSLDDLLGRLNFVDRHGGRILAKLKQPSQREQARLLLVDQLAELFEL